MKIFKTMFGNKHDKDVKDLLPLLHAVNERELWARGLSDAQFPNETERLKQEYEDHGKLDALLPDAFALAREAARRILGERPYDVQILGGIVLHQGRIMELKTGEGKTLSSTAPAYLNALSGKSVHIVTVNDYLVQRELQWMGPIFSFLGLTTGCVTHELPLSERKAAYNCDITYGTNNEIAFDYLRDNMRYKFEDKMQKGHHYCIIDEIDSILIDGSRTPLIISGSAGDDTRKYLNAKKAIVSLKECDKDPETDEYPEEPVGDFTIEEKSKKVSFTDEGMTHLEKICIQQRIFNGSLYDSENFEYIHYAVQALRAQKLFHRDTHYVVKEGKVEIVDEFTGRILHGRRYSDGLHQAIEAKEGIQIQQRSRTLASITFQNYFRMYDKISGMTGTAASEEREFLRIYGLDVVVVPTNRPVIRSDEDDLIYLNENDKFEAICQEIKEVNKKGQPVLVGTVSIDKSERLSKLLTKNKIVHEVLNAKNHAREANIIAEAGAEGSVTIATNMAGRGTDIKLGGNPEFRASQAFAKQDKPANKAKANTRKAAEDDNHQTASPIGKSSSEVNEGYAEILAQEMEHWLERSERVKELGGLYVLGTERHESRRIDNQLRGRSGRQGDPGMSRFFLSMDDELMRLFGGRSTNMKELMQKVGMQSGMAMNHSLLNKAIERAQQRVEERNFEIRKHLLKFDDVLNEQRSFVYNQRNEILQDDQLILRVLNTARDIISTNIQNLGEKKEVDAGIQGSFLAQLKEDFLITFQVDAMGQNLSEAGEEIYSAIEKNLRHKESIMTAPILNIALRREYLLNIDLRWQNHLENLDALRESVYLRSYAQKNPLLEYKLEGFQIFDEMLYEIRRTVLRKFLLVKIEGFDQQTPKHIPQGEMQHRELNLLQGASQRGLNPQPTAARVGTLERSALPASGARASSLPGQQLSKQAGVTVVRNQPKVGRNDPCPCGSGKKYKHCHGR